MTWRLSGGGCNIFAQEDGEEEWPLGSVRFLGKMNILMALWFSSNHLEGRPNLQVGSFEVASKAQGTFLLSLSRVWLSVYSVNVCEFKNTKCYLMAFLVIAARRWHLWWEHTVIYSYGSFYDVPSSSINTKYHLITGDYFSLFSI